MTYDRRRLRLNGVIHRIPKTHRYTATSYGLKVAFFCAKLYLRIFRPVMEGLVCPPTTTSPGLCAPRSMHLTTQIQKLREEAALAA